MNNHQVVQRALEILLEHIMPFIEDKMNTLYGSNFWPYLENGDCTKSKLMSDSGGEVNSFKKYKDVLFYLNALIKNWSAFQGYFPSSNYVLCLCHSIKYFRNRWAHQSQFSLRETHRFVDEVQVLVEQISGYSNAEIENLRKYVLELYYSEEVTKANIQEQNNLICYANSSNLSLPQSSLVIQDEAMTEHNDKMNLNSLHEANFQKVLTENQNNAKDKYIITYYEEN